MFWYINQNISSLHLSHTTQKNGSYTKEFVASFSPIYLMIILYAIEWKENLFVILGFKRTQIKSAKMWIWPGNIPSAVVGHLLKIKVDDEIWFRQLTQFSFFVVVDSHFVCVRIEECRQKVLSFLKERKKVSYWMKLWKGWNIDKRKQREIWS